MLFRFFLMVLLPWTDLTDYFYECIRNLFKHQMWPGTSRCNWKYPFDISKCIKLDLYVPSNFTPQVKEARNQSQILIGNRLFVLTARVCFSSEHRCYISNRFPAINWVQAKKIYRIRTYSPMDSWRKTFTATQRGLWQWMLRLQQAANSNP